MDAFHMRMSRTGRAVTGIVALAAGAAVLAGCSATTTGASSQSTGTPKQGGTARVDEISGTQPTAIFPIVTPVENNTTNAAFQWEMYSPLYFYGANDKIALDSTDSASQSTTWSADGKSVSITLKDWKWSNGETVDAQDVVFFLNLLKTNKSDWADYTPPNTQLGAEYFPDSVTNATASGQTVTISFDKAYNQTWMQENWLATITPLPLAWDKTSATAAGKCSTDAFGSTAAATDCAATYKYLASESTDDKNWASSPLWSIVDGPFKLTSFNATSGAYTIEPNADYSGTDKPYLSAVDFVPFTSDTAMYTALKAGSTSKDALQVGYVPAEDMSKYNAANIQAGNPLASAGYYYSNPIDIDLVSFYYLNDGNPTVSALFKQTYFIKALQDTVDQQGIVNGIAKGWGYPTYSLIPTLPAGNPISPELQADKTTFSVSDAKALLTANGWTTTTNPATCTDPGTGAGQCGAGIAKGQKASFSLNYGSGVQSAVTEVNDLVSNAALAGITITPDAMAYSALNNYMTSSTASSGGTAWQANWYGSWVYSVLPSGEGFLATGSGNNIMSFSDPTLDKLIYNVTVASNSDQAMYAYENYTATHAIPLILLPNFQNTFAPLAVANGFHIDAGDAFGGGLMQDWYYTK
jgi:peptide/nickel transport system substrate-binding protein